MDHVMSENDAVNVESAAPAPQAHADGRPADTCIAVAENGAYGWHAEIDLRRNPTIALLIIKSLAFIAICLSAIMLFAIMQTPKEVSIRRLLWVGSIVGGVYLFVLLITVVIYLIYAKVLGWRYGANYLMDETGVIFRPAETEGEVARNIALGTAAIAAIIGRYGITAAGVAAVDSDSVSSFKSVFRVKGIRKHCVIKVSQLTLYNQVYVAPQDYDFVYGFIRDHCPRARCLER